MSKVNRDEIIDAAIALFYEQGYAGTSMRDIAGAVGIRKPSLYHYFVGKQDLLLTILDIGLEKLIVPLEDILNAEGAPEEKLREAIHHHASLIAENPGVATLFLYEDHALDEEHRAHYVARRDAFEGVFRDILREGMETGVFRNTSVSISVQALLGMVNWMTRWYKPEGALSVAEIADVFADLFLGGQLEVKPDGAYQTEQ